MATSDPAGAIGLIGELEVALQTPWEKAFELTGDGRSYIFPVSLRGVPTDKIDESSNYWKQSWDSLEEFLSKESSEVINKENYRDLAKKNPLNKEFKDRAKLHQDNVSKHIKIREMFGPNGAYHPNQLVAEKYLPRGGLCQRELMYKLAVKVSDLRVLRERGFLQMDPFDFLRWRVSLQIGKPTNFGRRADAMVRPIINQLFEYHEGEKTKEFEDPILREAVLKSAKLQGRENSFKEFKPAQAKHKESSRQSVLPIRKRGRHSGSIVRSHRAYRVAGAKAATTTSISDYTYKASPTASTSVTSTAADQPRTTVYSRRSKGTLYSGVNNWKRQQLDKTSFRP